MTTGERMVWAAEFVRARGMGCRLSRAVEMASEAVCSMSQETAEPQGADARAMLDDMLSTGADR